MLDLRTRLTRLSYNLLWSWNEDIDEVFRAIDLHLWRRSNHNPVAFLLDVDPAVLASFENDAHILAHVAHAERLLTQYLETENHWTSWNAPGLYSAPVAYFSPEFCIHESIPIYSGGLGVLAGDHLKSCSDLGVPVYGVSLLYREGYFTQHLDGAGNQTEVYHDLDVNRVAIRKLEHNGQPLSVEIPMNSSVLNADLWMADVGRAKLVLLDVRGFQGGGGSPPLAMRLYGGDRGNRIAQEVVLGIGGYRALRKLGIRPGVIHLNEGHSAFAILEAITERMEETGQRFEQAASEITEKVAFTTHTPVEAGHDRFSPDMVLHYLAGLQQRLGISDRELLGLGRTDPFNNHEEFCMTVLALKLSGRANAVSSLHGQVSRRMWRVLWPERRTPDVPIGHITNGVHISTWLAKEMDRIFRDYLGTDWQQHQCDARRWRLMDNIDDVELWQTKVALKRRLFDFVERRARRRYERMGVPGSLRKLNPEALTIGFARRFALYKRAMLMFSDMARVRRLLLDPARPVQIIFAGKAHPQDMPAKQIIHQLVELSRDPELRDHILLVEDYDMNVSRHLLEGCDLWMNAPRRPLEACGTSGQKAVFNATLNCSTLDGWWAEAYDTRNGFAFGEGLTHTSPDVQDRRDAADMLNVLESRIVPLFYERDAQNIPVKWLAMIKEAMKTLAWRYNADRMVIDYVNEMYLPASKTLTREFKK
ncbi:MAG: alpha-glucan family phosphorylase [Deltaproteobacteria bacterium]|nr:alpha-glucan family phosphorylase [Deltaproteobacteria bacterium]